jgi:hypothetical protein
MRMFTLMAWPKAGPSVRSGPNANVCGLRSVNRSQLQRPSSSPAMRRPRERGPVRTRYDWRRPRRRPIP